MSSSGHLRLLTILGLILPIRDAVHAELQATPQALPLQTGVETPPPQTEAQTQQPMTVDVPQTPDPGTDESSTKVSLLLSSVFRPISTGPTQDTTFSKQPRHKGFSTDAAFRPPGSSEDDPFFYDEATLRKRGLLVAAVLFITGIVILTSGKCRQLSRLCRN